MCFTYKGELKMEHIFIINPVSGTTNPETYLRAKIEQVANKFSLSYKILVTEYEGHAKEIAKTYSQTGKAIRFYACGGDGTLNEVVEGTLGYPNVDTACIPCGSGNDFVRNFGTKEDFLNLEAMVQGERITIDLITTQYGIATAICSAGLDAQVAYGIPKFRRIPFCGGETSYKLSIITSLCSKLGHQLRIEADGEVFEDNFLMLAICNGKTYGGGFIASPNADMQDGLLDFVMVKKISRFRIAKVVNTYKQGKHIVNGKVLPEFQDIMTYRRVKEIHIQALDHRPIVVTKDGECAPRMQLDACITPNCANIVIPKRK